MKGTVLIALGIVCLILSVGIITVSIIKMKRDTERQKKKRRRQQQTRQTAGAAPEPAAEKSADLDRTVRMKQKELELDKTISVRHSPSHLFKSYMVALDQKDNPAGHFEHELRDAITIGRDPALNDISISDSSVSRKHCQISNYGGRFYVEDTGTNGNGSTYGTFVEGEQVIPGQKKQIFSDDSIRFGDIEFRIFFKEIRGQNP